jgi:hypothetical protein
VILYSGRRLQDVTSPTQYIDERNINEHIRFFHLTTLIRLSLISAASTRISFGFYSQEAKESLINSLGAIEQRVSTPGLRGHVLRVMNAPQTNDKRAAAITA